MAESGLPPDKPSHVSSPRSYAQVTAPTRVSPSAPSWFKFLPIPSTVRPPISVDNEPACLFTPLEVDQSALQFEHALIMKFSAGRPNPYDIKMHIKQHWGLSAEPIVSLIDPRHYLILPATYEDMILAQAHEVHNIANCMFRLYRWTKNLVFGKDSTEVPIWMKLPNLPLVYFNPTFLQRIGNSIGKFLRQDENTAHMQLAVHARICVEMDVAQPLPPRIWIGESKDNGFWQKIEYEGNNAFCTKCGLLGHVVGVCRKGLPKKAVTGNSNSQNKTTTTNGKQDGYKGKGRMEYRPRAHDSVQQQIHKIDVQNKSQEVMGTNNTQLYIHKDTQGGGQSSKSPIDTDQLHDTDQIHNTLVQSGLIDTPPSSSRALTVASPKSTDIHNNEALAVTPGSGKDNPITSESIQKELFTKLDAQKTSSGVITTPTKNRFDVLDTENELNKAFSNLQRSELAQSMALMTIPEVPEGVQSDGSGTPSKSNTGVPRTRSASNSDDEREDDLLPQHLEQATPNSTKVKSSKERKGRHPTRA